MEAWAGGSRLDVALVGAEAVDITGNDAEAGVKGADLIMGSNTVLDCIAFTAEPGSRHDLQMGHAYYVPIL